MDAETLIGLFGTAEPLPATRRLVAGPLEVELAAGAVRAVRWKGVEVLRGIDYPIRDPDWGTFPQVTLDEAAETNADGFRYRRSFTAVDGALTGDFSLDGRPGALLARLVLRPARSLAVNRAGFTVLHPVEGTAGSALLVTHPDGAAEATRFPDLISPGQPVFAIRALRQSAKGVAADIAFSGDIFEMEDQRNWSDASYKTYCRPLSLPCPYEIGPATPVEQAIAIAFSGPGAPAAATGSALRLAPHPDPVPEVTLSLEPGWQTDHPALDHLAPAATRLRLDLTDPVWADALPALLASVRGALDLELVTPDDVVELDAALAAAAQQLRAHAAAPRNAIALPRAFLRSYQPDAVWPPGATPEQAATALRRHFPAALVLGGMLTNFTELNRCRAAAALGAALTHGTTAIVHAADDLSVMQTLEALPQVFASAAALAPGRPCHLGLVAIGMRSNPYGAGLAPNPGNVRRPMAAADPRQRGRFAAAFMVGAMAATEAGRVAGLSLAAPAGPMGLVGPQGPNPAWHVFRFLARLGGAPRLAVAAPAGVLGVAADIGGRVALALANITALPVAVPLPGPAEIALLPLGTLAPDWLDTAPRHVSDAVTLDAYGVAFLSLASPPPEASP